METASRNAKLQVVTNWSGRIVAALWPEPRKPGDPTSVGVVLGPDETVHEVEIPPELRDSLTLDLENFTVQVDAEGRASLAAMM
ncbi:hypothetical protein [Streptomyces sp. NPDC004134]|uniref:hypothetical protein n=1 Tax=Streptomyces sp. NPDC004134 TaxID=3364691 RepID=UPI0036A11ADC